MFERIGLGKTLNILAVWVLLLAFIGSLIPESVLPQGRGVACGALIGLGIAVFRIIQRRKELADDHTHSRQSES